jgi:transcription elongation factor/antiterminator RfaH
MLIRSSVSLSAGLLPCSPSWFVVFTSPRHEKRVAERFARLEIENFLPMYEVLRVWRNRQRKRIQLPLFPSYIFVRIDRGETVPVLSTPGVISIVTTGRELVPLADSDIESLRDGLKHRSIEPYPCAVIGQRVRIKSGAMAGWEGVLVRKSNNLRVVLNVEMIQQSISVEVGAEELEASYRPHLKPTVLPDRVLLSTASV